MKKSLVCDKMCISRYSKALSYFEKRHRDFEDDLIIVAAQQSGANCVVTSDAELISHFPEYCKTPAEIVAALRGGTGINERLASLTEGSHQ